MILNTITVGPQGPHSNGAYFRHSYPSNRRHAASANRATEAALAAYPGRIVDRVVKLSNGEYNVHYIGVNWPHHVFVNQDFKVVGAL